jgi:hypothetical protein
VRRHWRCDDDLIWWHCLAPLLEMGLHALIKGAREGDQGGGPKGQRERSVGWDFQCKGLG